MSKLGAKDLEFLRQLDNRLHKTKEMILTPNICGAPRKVSIDEFTDESMNKDEIQMVLEKVERCRLAFYPINTNMGFSVGFQVANSTRTEKPLLTFTEKQLPEEYNFEKLSEYFMRPENIKRANERGIPIVNNHSCYTY